MGAEGGAGEPATGDLPGLRPFRDFSDLAATIRFAEATLLLPGAARLGDDLRFLGKLRGALGTALMDTASAAVKAGQDCDWLPPCGYQVLWRHAGEVRPGFPVPAPWVLQSDSVGGDLAVTLRLFGMAADYLGEASEALLRGIRGGLSATGALEIGQRLYAETDGIAVPAITAQASLEFLTPLVIRNHDKGSHIDPAALLRGLVHRADGMARWHGLRLEKDAAVALTVAAGAVEGAWEAVDARRWNRGAVRQGKVVPMEGATGVLHLRGELGAFAALLALGQVIFAGSRTSWGQGRYRITHGL